MYLATLLFFGAGLNIITQATREGQKRHPAVVWAFVGGTRSIADGPTPKGARPKAPPSFEPRRR
jgi:hypothetical protein